MRYIKRNGLYILIVCVLLLVVGAVIAVVGQVKRLSPAKNTHLRFWGLKKSIPSYATTTLPRRKSLSATACTCAEKS